MLDNKIIVIDNFYDDPYAVRETALKLDYPKPHDGYTYPGKNSVERYHPEEVHEKIESILKERIEPSQACGAFRLSLEKDSYKQDIHIDPDLRWGGVLYLSDPKDSIPEAGTSFWRHKSLGMESAPQTIDEARYYGYGQIDECRDSIVYHDGLDRSKWDRYFLSEMKFNRLVLFRTNLWHSHNVNFGDTLENGRLVQLFFYKIKHGYLE